MIDLSKTRVSHKDQRNGMSELFNKKEPADDRRSIASEVDYDTKKSFVDRIGKTKP